MCTSQDELVGLIERARRGESDARGRLLELYRNYISVLARLQIDRRLQGKMAPSDLVQETFLEAEKRFGQFYGQSEGELIVWLRRVLSTQVARSYRFHSAQKRDFHLEQSLNNEIDASSELLQQVTDPRHSSPSRSAARREEAVLLSNALEQLPEDYRNVILLRNLQGLSFGEVAARMNRTADSVKNLWARALSQLRDTMRRNV